MSSRELITIEHITDQIKELIDFCEMNETPANKVFKEILLTVIQQLNVLITFSIYQKEIEGKNNESYQKFKNT